MASGPALAPEDRPTPEPAQRVRPEPRRQDAGPANEAKGEVQQPSARDTRKGSRQTPPGEPNPSPAVADTAPATSGAVLANRSSPKGLAGEIVHVASAGNRVALTLDAGASAVPTPAILDTLKSAGLHLTFFLTGKWCEQNEALVRRIHAEGHEIANHSYSHPDFRKLSESEMIAQLEKTSQIVARITGEGTAPLFRPPYGGRDKRVLQVASNAGYTSIYWSIDSWDAFKKNITSAEIKKRILDRVRGGDIILAHCGSQPTADALPSLIQELQGRGYEIVTVSELLRSGSR